MNKNTKTGAKSLSIAYFALFVVVGDATQVSAIATPKVSIADVITELENITTSIITKEV